jgi:hypothetical protein
MYSLVFGFLSNPMASSQELAQTAVMIGISITAVSLGSRMHACGAACLRGVLERAVQQVLAADPVAIPLFDRFTQVRDQFATSRKYALAFLEYLDEQKVTRRSGDVRVRY